MALVWRVECIEVAYTETLSRLCHQVKNLYNRANFLIKESLSKMNKLLSYYEINSLLNSEECYTKLPAQTAQQTLKLLVRNWKAYFQALKEWSKKPEKFFVKPRPPNYKPKDGEGVAILTNQQIRLKNGWINLPKKVGFYHKTRLTASCKFREVRIVPRQVGYTLEIVYEKTIPKHVKKRIRKEAIDLGTVNIVAFVDNLGNEPIVVKDHGKGIKSIINYYQKKQAKIRTFYTQQQKKLLKNQQKLVYGSAYYKLRDKFRKKLKKAVHHLTVYLVELFIERGLHEVFVGYSPKWKQQVNLGKRINQMFVNIPFLKIINQLKYKAEEHGIVVETVLEEYTSKSSFLNNEYPQSRGSYAGRRRPRGLFTSAQGYRLHADINAAYNILIKSDPNALPPRSADGVGGYVIYPRRVCVDPPGMTHALGTKCV